MVSMGSPQRMRGPKVGIQATLTPFVTTRIWRRSDPDKGQRLWSQCHSTADDDRTHGCLQARVLINLAVLLYFHLLKSIKLDIYWPQTIFCIPVTQKWLHFKKWSITCFECITETGLVGTLWIINTGDSSWILCHGTFFPNVLYYIHLF